MKAGNYLQKTLDLSLSTEIIKQTHGLMMNGEKDILAGEYKKSPAFAGYHIFAQVGCIERHKEGAIFRFHKTIKDDLIWLLQIYLEALSISIHLKMGMEELVAWFWIML